MAELSQLINGTAVYALPLQEGTICIGQAEDNDVQLIDPDIGLHHACIYVEKNAYLDEILDIHLESINSNHGCYINNNRINKKTQLNDQDIIRIGENEFQLQDRAEDLFEFV